MAAFGRDDARDGRALIQRALRLFEEMDAAGWIDEARTSLPGGMNFRRFIHLLRLLPTHETSQRGTDQSTA